MNKGNRKRNIKLQFYVNEKEKELIKKKMALTHINNFGAYARKICIDGLIINIDLSDFKEYGKEVNAIGRNINQAIKILHTHPNNKEIQNTLSEGLKKVWQLQRSILSKLL